MVNSIPTTTLKPPKPSLLKVMTFSSNNYLQLQVQLMHEYPEIVELPFMKNHYSIFHPDYLEQVLRINEKNYDKQEFSYDAVSAIMGESILTTSRKDYWHNLRKQCQPSFQPEYVLQNRPLIARTLGETLKKWESWSIQDKTFDMGFEIQRLIMQIAGEILLGDSFTPLAPLVLKFSHYANHYTHSGMYKYKWLPTPLALRYHKTNHTLRQRLTHMIQMRQTEEIGSDFLSRLICVQDPDTGAPLSDTQITDQIITFLMTGFESTSSALTWVWQRLAYSRESEVKLQAEADSFYQEHCLADFELKFAPYCEQVFKEILRLYPSVWLFGRRALGGDALGPYQIQQDDKIVICPYAIHRHPEFWQAPDKFNPDRFSKTEMRQRPRFCYLPFGIGPRTCIGMSMAMLMSCMIITAIARHFTIRPVNNEFMEPDPLMFMRTKKRGQVKLILREPVEL